MPINRLRKREMKFAQIGDIRKGTRDDKTGKMTDLEYFRVVFDEARWPAPSSSI